MHARVFRYLFVLFDIVLRPWVVGFVTDLANCHDDFDLKPPDGVLQRYSFNWLGFVQYSHVNTSLLYHDKAPRVVLIHRQYVVGTATDMLRLPDNYKLGNIVFGEYEQEEKDCGLTQAQLKLGGQCPRAYIEMPILDITPHPEYSRFGVLNSLAIVKLLRPMKSNYMVPICMPSLGERYKQKKTMSVFLVDYMSSVPRDFDEERMAKKTLKLYTHAECQTHRYKYKLGSEGVTHVLCTSGCGVRAGAPIVSHTSEGAFELIGLAASSGPCTRKSMRRRFIKDPPLYIDVYPYTTWIINVISAKELPTAYPQNIMRVDGGSSIDKVFLRKRKPQRTGWRGRIFMTGDYCFRDIKKQRRSAYFYSEKFEVNVDPPAKLTVIQKISAGPECTIVCARLLLPNRMIRPVIEGVGGYNITVQFSTSWFPYTFYYAMSLGGKNSTKKDLSEWMWEETQGIW